MPNVSTRAAIFNGRLCRGAAWGGFGQRPDLVGAVCRLLVILEPFEREGLVRPSSPPWRSVRSPAIQILARCSNLCPRRWASVASARLLPLSAKPKLGMPLENWAIPSFAKPRCEVGKTWKNKGFCGTEKRQKSSSGRFTKTCSGVR